MHYENTNADVVRALLANNAEATNPQHTLNTARAANGNTVLLSYDWARVAEVTADGDVIVYEGHRSTSDATKGHIETVTDVVESDRIERLSSKPVDGEVPDCFEYVDSYVGGFDSMSPVDKLAFESVRSTMRRRLK